jgi:hypothetical protein
MTSGKFTMQVLAYSLVVIGLSFAAHAQTLAPLALSHPGLLNDSASMPWYSANALAGVNGYAQGYNEIATATDNAGALFINHVPHPAVVYTAVHWSLPGPARDCLDDGKAMYGNMLLYETTGNLVYATKAKEIINAWSYTMTSLAQANGTPANPATDRKQDYMLYSSYTWPTFLWGAEMLRNVPAAGWTAADQNKFASLLTGVIRPAVESPGNYLVNNWGSWRVGCKLTMAAYLNDYTRFYQSQEDWRRQLDAYIKSDLYGEMSRDLWHSQMGIAPLVASAEAALKQGIDLFSYDNNRLYKTIEYQAQFCIGDTTNWPFSTGPNMGTQTTGETLWNMYQTAYHHYHDRLGLPCPNMERVLASMTVRNNNTEAYQPEDFLRMGYGTLTHYGDPQLMAAIAGFDKLQNLQTDLGFTINSGTAAIITDPTWTYLVNDENNNPVPARNGVLELSGTGGASVTRHIRAYRQLDLDMDLDFRTAGTLMILLDGHELATINAPASGSGLNSFGHFQQSFNLADFDIAGGDNLDLTLELLGGSSSHDVLVDNLIAQSLPQWGDVNRDDSVNVIDLGILATNYGKSSNTTWLLGDFNGDGAVDVVDLGLLATWYDQTTPGFGSTTLPEPMCISMLMAGSIAVFRKR